MNGTHTDTGWFVKRTQALLRVLERVKGSKEVLDQFVLG